MWSDEDFEKEPIFYRMTVHPFRATSSPSCCNFALKRTAVDFGEQFDSKVADTIFTNIYVDDCLSSVSFDTQSISLIEDVSALCQYGGFHIAKWISDIPSVIQSLPDEERAKGIQSWNFDDDLPNESALGVHWFIEIDFLGFQMKLKEQPPTRCGILSIHSSVYYPIWIIAPFVVNAKHILQSLCKRGYGWDKEITGADLRKWNDWVTQLSNLESITIDICYKPPNFENVTYCQLES